jgi:hypothetical protein
MNETDEIHAHVKPDNSKYCNNLIGMEKMELGSQLTQPSAVFFFITSSLHRSAEKNKYGDFGMVYLNFLTFLKIV